MSIVIVSMIVIILVVVGIIQSYKAGLFQRYQPRALDTVTTTSNFFAPVGGWSQVDYSTIDGHCFTYTRKSDSDGYNSVTLSSLENCYDSGECYRNQVSTTPVCIDPDQLFAKKIYRVCNNPIGTNAGSGCIKQNGTKARVNEGEVSWVICSNPPICTGQIGLFNLSHRRTASSSHTPKVLQSTGDIGDTVSIVDPDLTQPNQVFRLDRFGLDSSFKPTQINVYGRYVSISHRITGHYLIPTLPTGSDGLPIFNTTLSNNTGVTFIAPSNKITGRWWLLVPPLPSSDLTYLMPQQIVYIGTPAKYPVFAPINYTGTSGTGTGTGSTLLNPYSPNAFNVNIIFKGLTITDQTGVRQLTFNGEVYMPIFLLDSSEDAVFRQIVTRVINSQFGKYFGGILSVNGTKNIGGTKEGEYIVGTNNFRIFIDKVYNNYMTLIKQSDYYINVVVNDWQDSGTGTGTSIDDGQPLNMATYVSEKLSLQISGGNAVLKNFLTTASLHTQFLNMTLFQKILNGQVADFSF